MNNLGDIERRFRFTFPFRFNWNDLLVHMRLEKQFPGMFTR